MQVLQTLNTRRTHKKAIMAAAALAGIVTLASLGFAWSSFQEADRSVEVDSWEKKHPGLHWEITFEAEVKDGKTIVSVQEADADFEVLGGHRPLWGAGSQGPPEQDEKDDPSCSSQCWQGYASIAARSEPGLVKSFPYTNWVNWVFYPQMKAGGESVVTFTSHVPSDGGGNGCPGTNPNCDDIKQWKPYGKWTLETTPFTLTYDSTTWGGTYTVQQGAPIVEVFTVKQG